MSDADTPKSWWQTLPGVIASIAAALTAVSGLIVAVKQSGWFDRSTPSPHAAPAPAAIPAAPPSAAAAAHRPRSDAAPPPARSTAAAVALPAMHAYDLGPESGKATFTLLSAEVAPKTTEKKALRIRVRMTNHDRYDKNFWDRSFRLLIDDVPMEPDSNLNELVPAAAAREGVVSFSIPRATPAAKLRITYYDESTEIPLDLAAIR